jgi:hypothetical protein
MTRTVHDQVPAVAREALEAASAHDISRFLDCFVADAAVDDWGRSSPDASRSAADVEPGFPRTVQTYISHVLTKPGAKSRVEIVREAMRQGFTP